VFSTGALHWKEDLKLCAGAGGQITGDEHAAMFADDSLGDSQAQPSATGIQSRRDERFEEPGEHIRIDAGSIIADGEGDPGTIGAFLAEGVDGDGGAAGRAIHCINRIADEVDENLHDAITIADQDQIRGAEILQGKARGLTIQSNKGDGLFNHGSDVDR